MGPAFACGDRIEAGELEQGTWLVLLRADQLPHLVLLQDGTCHSLEHDGLQRFPAAQLWRLIEARRVPALLCRLAVEHAPPVAAFFDAHPRIQGEVDCFVPVRDWCVAWLPAAAACEFAYELLPLLAGAGRLARSGGLHLPLDADGHYVLPRYTQAEVRARIAEVRRRGGATS